MRVTGYERFTDNELAHMAGYSNHMLAVELGRRLDNLMVRVFELDPPIRPTPAGVNPIPNPKQTEE